MRVLHNTYRMHASWFWVTASDLCTALQHVHLVVFMPHSMLHIMLVEYKTVHATTVQETYFAVI